MKTRHSFWQLTVFFIMASLSAIHAADVGENDILVAARKWIADNAVFQSESPSAVPQNAVQMTEADGRPLPLWRVDLQPMGYLVMSSDDTLPPVVAFDTKGSFDMPAGHPLTSMLARQSEIFRAELEKPQTRGNKLAEENKARWNILLNRTRAESTTLSTIVRQPMLATTWNQDSPYNYFCTSGSMYTERAVTGCVALAVAQMLKYHEWPVAGVGTKTHTDDDGAIQGTLKADFSVPYDWASMAASYQEKDEREYGAAELSVARLAMEAGVLVEADYELEETSAGSWNLHTLMSQYLGYSDSAVYGDTRSGMVGYVARSTLYSRIRTDMTAGRPAFVSFDGHTFIADGLGTMGGQDYYHFNYGWGGQHDGWYLLTDGEEGTMVVAATTNIQPKPVAVFKPMSREQASSFTLSWDFPKRLAAEAFRLTKTTGTRASTVISSSISGTARSYNLTGQSGTATYTLEAKVGGSWQAVSDGVTITVKTSPAAMLTLSVDDNLKSIAGKQATTTITANNSLTSLTVTSSRPDILPTSGISVSGSGASRTVRLTPSSGVYGNVLLYVTATDAAGNTVRQAVPFGVMVDEPLNWRTVKSEAFEAAAAGGKLVLMVAGRNTCPNTNYFRNTVCETTDIKATLLANYELWYVIVDNSSEYYTYSSGLGSTLPFIAIVDPANSSKRLRGHGGPMYAAEARVFLNPNTPYFSLDDGTAYVNGTTKSLELSVLVSGAEIRYTLNGTTPTASSSLYSSAISLMSTTTVSARAFRNGAAISDTVTKTYTFMDQVTKPTLSTGETDYFYGSRLVTASCVTPGAVIRYTTNLYYPTASDPVFPAGGLEITEDTVLLIRAFKDGMLQSDWAVSELFGLVECPDANDIVTGGGVTMYTTATPWTRDTTTYYSSPSSMKSGAIEHSSSTALVARVTGPGTFAFKWKVSSESGYDKLTFTIDGVTKNTISGTSTVNWAEKTYTVTGSGDHYLAWTYSKDSSDSSGSDCGWVDDVSYAADVPPVPVSAAVTGPDSIATASTATYTCKVTWDNGNTTDETTNASWNLSSTTYAAVSAGVVTNKNTTTTNKTVTLNATFTSNGVTVRSADTNQSKSITLAKKDLTGIAISGPNSIDNNATATYTCTASWTCGGTTTVTPTWSLSSTTYASVSTAGIVMNKNTTPSDKTVTLNASYTANGVTKTANPGKTITLLGTGDANLTWLTDKTEVFTAATEGGKFVLMVAGRDTCPNTNYFRNTVCETSDVKATLLEHYVLWYANVDVSSSGYSTYSSGLGSTLPFLAIIDPAASSSRLRGHGGYMSIAEGRLFLNMESPYFSLDDGTIYVNGTMQSLELSVLVSGAQIRYTLNGTTPTASSALYSSAISLTSTTTVSARAFKNGTAISDTVTKTYTFLDQVAKPVLNVPQNDYFYGSCLVTATCATSGATIRYTTDGYIPTASSPVFPVGGVTVAEYTTIAVKAFKDGMKESDYSYSILTPYELFPEAQAIVIKGDVTMLTAGTPWFLQTSTYYSSPSAMQSGAIGNNASTVLAAKVIGSGKLSFRWKVSSEQRYDKLSVTIDNVVQENDTISGTVDWTQKEYTIAGDGDHYVTWTYAKDGSQTGGSDCAWVDNIVWEPNVQVLELTAGWNWVSFNVLPQSQKVGDVLGTAGFTANDVIQSSTGSSRFTGTSWIPSSFTIEYGKLYMVSVSTPMTVTVSGAGATSTSLSISAGWNWIANPTTTAITPSQLRHSAGWSAGDCIQGVSGSVTYSGSRWIPSTGFTLEPGKGYQIRAAKAGTISFGD